MLQFIHISDTHLHPDRDFIEEDAQYASMVGLEALVQHLNALPFNADFILHTGDIVYRATVEAYTTVQQFTARLKIPVYCVAGNLDDSRLVQTLLLHRAESELQPALYYTFEVNGVQIVCLDSNGSAPYPAGNISDDQLAWLQTLCDSEDEHPLIIAVHHNPLKVGVPWLDDTMRITNGDALHEIFVKARRRPLGVFHGHIHQNFEVVRDGIPYSSVSSSCFQFQGYSGLANPYTVDVSGSPGYSVVTVTEQQLFSRRYTFSI